MSTLNSITTKQTRHKKTPPGWAAWELPRLFGVVVNTIFQRLSHTLLDAVSHAGDTGEPGRFETAGKPGEKGGNALEHGGETTSLML